MVDVAQVYYLIGIVTAIGAAFIWAMARYFVTHKHLKFKERELNAAARLKFLEERELVRKTEDECRQQVFTTLNDTLTKVGVQLEHLATCVHSLDKRLAVREALDDRPAK